MSVPASLPTTAESLLPLVLAAMANTPNERLRTLLAALTAQLHRFVIDNAVSETELEHALAFIVGIGQATGDSKNEAVLASDLFGISTLVTLLHNPHGGTALLGPFWRDRSPPLAHGARIACDDTTGAPLHVEGRVADSAGTPIADATVDVWQASPVGLYENQDESQPDMNLRGRFTTDGDGRYHFRTVYPAGYPVPTDGPCGDLLRAQQRQPYRPAHLHFMVSKPGYKVLVTQVFPPDAEHLHADPVFGVIAALVGRFENGRLERDFTLLPGATVFPKAPIP